MERADDASDSVSVYYDGACGLCRGTIEYLRGHDTGRRLEFQDIRGPEFDATAEGLQGCDLETALHVRLPGGDIVRGADAVIAAAATLPQGRALGYVSAIPGVRWVARHAYGWIARNRYRLGPHVHNRSHPRT